MLATREDAMGAGRDRSVAPLDAASTPRLLPSAPPFALADAWNRSELV